MKNTNCHKIKDKGYILLETLVALSLSSLLLAIFLLSLTTFIKTSTSLQKNYIATQEIRRIEAIIGQFCERTQERFEVSKIALAKNKLVNSSGQIIRINRKLKNNSSSFAVSLIEPMSILSRISSAEPKYCSTAALEKKYYYFLAIQPQGVEVLYLRRNKTRCLLQADCPCVITFRDLEKSRKPHTLFPLAHHLALYIDSNNTLRWHSFDSQSTQPLAYDIEIFNVEELSQNNQRILSFKIKHKHSALHSFNYSIGPKNHHVLDSIF